MAGLQYLLVRQNRGNYLQAPIQLFMKILSATAHGLLDYLVVAFLLASPPLFGMTGGLATFTYILGSIHLLLTLLTNFKPGMIKLIPFRLHGIIEFVVVMLLAGVAYLFYRQKNFLGHDFYLFFSLALLIIFLFTDYNGTRKPKYK